MSEKMIELIDEKIAEIDQEAEALRLSIERINEQHDTPRERREATRRIHDEYAQLLKWKHEYEKHRAALVEKVEATPNHHIKTMDDFANVDMTPQQLFEALNDPGIRKMVSNYTQKLNMAADVVKYEWMIPRQFEDGKWDSVCLNADTMRYADEIEELNEQEGMEPPKRKKTDDD